MSLSPITEHVVKTPRHTTSYLAAGPERGPLIIFVHGWPELSISWRHQLPCFAALGFRAIAPDMRGYGRSSVPGRHEDYAQEEIVADMLELLAALDAERAVWVGHDWGSPVVWNIASHHPDQTVAVASLCVPYYTLERGFEQCLALVDRDLYPEAEFPAGQWEYQCFYEENFAKAQSAMEADVAATVKALFRKGSPEGRGKPAVTAMVRKTNGWFGGLPAAPDLPRDVDVITESDLHAYAAALSRNGFFGANSYYMNHTANGEYATRAANDGVLDMPVLFIGAEYDYVCETVTSRLAEPMQTYCRKLSTSWVDSGHWMAQEKPREVNAALAGWLATEVAEWWPG